MSVGVPASYGRTPTGQDCRGALSGPYAREKPDLALLQQALAAACRRPEPDLRRKEILELLVDLTNAAAGAYLLLGPSGDMEIVAEVTAGRGNVEAKAVQKDLQNAAATSCKRQRLVVIGRGTAGSVTILASPLQGGEGPIGSVALLFSDPVQGGESIPTTAGQLIAAVADTLDAFGKGAEVEAPGRKRLGGRAKALIGLTLAIAVAGLLMVPTGHRLKAASQLEPEPRRFVVAPFDGVLETSRFKPGDGVEPGDILATLDGRELELELVSLRAQRDKLSKQRDVSLAAGETAATQITELELARTRAGLGLLEYKRTCPEPM